MNVQRKLAKPESWITKPDRDLLKRDSTQSRKLVNCSGRSRSISRNIAITFCKSSRFLPVTRTWSP